MRRDTGRFHEIRYEDLTSDTRLTLTPILATFGLQWHSACALEAHRLTFATSKEKEQSDTVFTAEMFGPKVPGLMELCADFDYSTTVPYSVPVVAEKGFASSYDLRLGIVLDYIPLKQFERRGGLAWFTPLPQLTHLADNVDDPNRSLVGVMEGPRMIGPAHALHELIRRWGRGTFSHWLDGIYLSTSDGSNPNFNGRCYFALVPRHPAQSTGATTHCDHAPSSFRSWVFQKFRRLSLIRK